MWNWWEVFQKSNCGLNSPEAARFRQSVCSPPSRSSSWCRLRVRRGRCACPQSRQGPVSVPSPQTQEVWTCLDRDVAWGPRVYPEGLFSTWKPWRVAGCSPLTAPSASGVTCQFPFRGVRSEWTVMFRGRRKDAWAPDGACGGGSLYPHVQHLFTALSCAGVYAHISLCPQDGLEGSEDASSSSEREKPLIQEQ